MPGRLVGEPQVPNPANQPVVPCSVVPLRNAGPIRRGHGIGCLREASSGGYASPRTQGRQNDLILDPVSMQVVAVGVEPALGAFDMVADAADDAPEPGRVVHLDE